MSYSSSSALDNLIAAQKRSRQHPDGEDGHLPTVTEASTYGDILVHAQKITLNFLFYRRGLRTELELELVIRVVGRIV